MSLVSGCSATDISTERVTWGTDSPDELRSLAVAPDGIRYVAGTTEGIFPGAAHAGRADVFVSRVSSAGNIEWTRQWGTSAHDVPVAIVIQGDRLIVVWNEFGVGIRLQSLAMSDGALLDASSIDAGVPAFAGAALLQDGLLWITGDVRLESEGESYNAAWLAKVQLDGTVQAAWNNMPVNDYCGSSTTGTSIAWANGPTIGLQSSCWLSPESTGKGIYRFDEALQFISGWGLGSSSAGGPTVSAVAERLYSVAVDGTPASGWQTAVVQQDGWEAVVALEETDSVLVSLARSEQRIIVYGQGFDHTAGMPQSIGKIFSAEVTAEGEVGEPITLIEPDVLVTVRDALVVDGMLHTAGAHGADALLLRRSWP